MFCLVILEFTDGWDLGPMSLMFYFVILVFSDGADLGPMLLWFCLVILVFSDGGDLGPADMERGPSSFPRSNILSCYLLKSVTNF
jgi:hypothetical protein